MVKIIITELDKYDIAIKRFRRLCMHSGLYLKTRQKAFNIAPSVKRRKQKLASHSYVLYRNKRVTVKYKQ